MRIVNLCPHELNLRIGEHKEVVIPPSDKPARLTTERLDQTIASCETAAAAGNATLRVPISQVRTGTVHDLPEPEDGIYFVVSYFVAFACPDRDDLLVPDELVRDKRGVVVACRTLAHFFPEHLEHPTGDAMVSAPA